MAHIPTPEQLSAVTDRVTALFERELQIAPPSADTDLFESSALDSLSFVTLLAGLESEFGVSIPLDAIDLEHFASIDAISRFVAHCQIDDDISRLSAAH